MNTIIYEYVHICESMVYLSVFKCMYRSVRVLGGNNELIKTENRNINWLFNLFANKKYISYVFDTPADPDHTVICLFLASPKDSSAFMCHMALMAFVTQSFSGPKKVCFLSQVYTMYQKKKEREGEGGYEREVD